MTAAIHDRIIETTTTTGTGNYVLGGAAAGGRAFSVIGAGPFDVDYVCIAANDDGTFETGRGVYNAGEITRAAIIDSSNGGAIVDWGPGDKVVFIAPAGKTLDRLHDVVVCGVAAGTSSAITLTPAVPVKRRVGLTLIWQAAATNPGAATLNPSATGAAAIQNDGVALVGGEIVTGKWYISIWDGTAWQTMRLRLQAAVDTIPGTFALTGVISPTALAANTNDYAPTGLSAASRIRQDVSGANRDLTGLTGGAAGRRITIHNIASTYNLVLKDESSSSAAANRFAFPADITLKPDQAIELEYDSTSSRWRAVAYPAPDPATPQFNAAYVSTDQTMVAAGQLVLAHGLGAVPKLVKLELISQGTDAGYSNGDVLEYAGADNGFNQGLSVVKDATNITIRVGSGGLPIAIINKSSGASSSLAVTNWKLRVKAWA